MSMRIDTFMSEFNVRQTDEKKEAFVKHHVLKEYVPFEKKMFVAQSIVENSYWNTIVDKDGNEIKTFHINSPAKYVLTCMTMVTLYTDIDIELSDGKMIENFNTLNKPGILDMILSNIDQREIKEFNMVIEMVADDVITNEYESHAFISKQVERFGALVGTALAPVLEKVDMSKIEEIMKQIG